MFQQQQHCLRLVGLVPYDTVGLRACDSFVQDITHPSNFQLPATFFVIVAHHGYWLGQLQVACQRLWHGV
jgi:hypothetical protein